VAPDNWARKVGDYALSDSGEQVYFSGLSRS